MFEKTSARSASSLGYESVTPRQHDARNPFTRISNALIEDRTVNGDAHWLLDWALSRPPGWKFEHGHVEHWFAWCQHKLDRVLKLLKQGGYLIVVQTRNPDGTRGKDLFFFFEDPRQSRQAEKTFADLGALTLVAPGTFAERVRKRP